MENFIYCTEEEIIGYLKQFGGNRDSRDTELSEAVRLKRLYEKSFSKPFLVGIPVSQEGLRQMKAGTVSKNEAIKKFRKDDTDVDILIIDAADSQATPRDGIIGSVKGTNTRRIVREVLGFERDGFVAVFKTDIKDYFPL